MKTVEVIFNGNEKIITQINGTRESIIKYYLGKWFNFGIEGDIMRQAIKINFLEMEI